MDQILPMPGMSLATWREHDVIVTAMVRGETEDAAQATNGHIAKVMDRTLERREAVKAWRRGSVAA